MKKTILIATCFLLLNTVGYAKLPLGERPPTVILNKGKTDGSTWSSKEIQGKVYVMFYVDPDENEMNQHAKKVLTNKNLPSSQFGIIAVMNLAATWLPDFAIESMLQRKQKESVNIVYVKDRDKILVQNWGLTDHSFDVIAFDKKGRVIFRKEGRLYPEDLENLISVITSNLD